MKRISLNFNAVLVLSFMLLVNKDYGLAQSADSWSPQQPASYVNRSASIVLNGKIYVFGSDDPSGVASSFSRVYDPVSNQWTTLKPIPTHVGAPSIATVNSLIYVIGGYNPNDGSLYTPSPNQVYDPSSDSWSTVTSPNVARAFATAQAVSGKIYLIGGCTCATKFSDVEQFDPVTNQWSRMASMPTARAAMASAVIGTNIYVVGGGNDTTAIGTTEVYDASRNVWTTKSPMPTARTEFGMALVGDHIFAFGGVTGPGYTGAHEEYDSSTDTWMTRAPIPVAMGGNTGAAVNGLVYSIGINRTDGTTQVNYDYTPLISPFNAQLTVNLVGSGTGTVTSIPTGISCGTSANQCFAGFPIGTTVILTAAPAAHSNFQSWAGCDKVSGLTCTVNLTSQRGVFATFAASVNAQLTVIVNGSGSGTVTSSPAGISCGTATNQCSAGFPSGSTITLTATPATGSNFQSWAGCDNATGSTCTVNLASQRGVFATFTTSVPLTVKTNGSGTVTSTPVGINCGPTIKLCTATFPVGTQVMLVAAAAPNSVFGGWTPCDSTAGSNCTNGCDSMVGLTCTVGLSGAPRSVTATFLKLISLTVVRNGDGTGTVTSNPSGINCGATANGCTAVFPSLSQATLSAIPSPGSNFGGWSGCNSTNGTVCTMVFGSIARTVTATFVKGRPAFDVIQVLRTGTGTGLITSNPPGINCAPDSGNPCSGTFVRGTQVTLTATPTVFSDFGGWLGCGKASGLNCTFTITSSRTVSVAFNGGTPVNRNLQVSLIGSGSGLVTSNPGGISCPTTCSATFEPVQQTIVLTPLPSAGSTFAGWNGCDSLSGTNCIVLLSNVTKLVTAKFSKVVGKRSHG